MTGPEIERGEPVAGTGNGRWPRGCPKEIRKLIQTIEALGGRVVRNASNGHGYKVYLGAAYIGGLAGTPGSSRSWANDIARLRRNGLPIDMKGRPL